MPETTTDIADEGLMKEKRRSVLARLSPLISERLKVNIADVTENKHIDNDLLSDSLSDGEIIMEVEDEFQIGIPEETISRIQTIGDIVTTIIELHGK